MNIHKNIQKNEMINIIKYTLKNFKKINKINII